MSSSITTQPLLHYAMNQISKLEAESLTETAVSNIIHKLEDIIDELQRIEALHHEIEAFNKENRRIVSVMQEFNDFINLNSFK